MPIRVLIVDDSGFFRHRIQEMLSDDRRIEVVGSAINGREAVDKAKQLRPDVITMDVEMPQLNGIDAVRIIMRECPTNVLMLSSLTYEGARITLQALEAGAADYLSKDIRAWMEKNHGIRDDLVERIVALGASRRFQRSSFGVDKEDTRTGTKMVFRPDSRSSTSTRRSTSSETPASRATRTPVERTTTRPEPAARRTVPPRSSTASTTTRTTVPERRTPSSSARTPARERAPVAERPASRLVVSDDQRQPTSNAARVKFPDCRLLVIGSSTGGPAALQEILTKIPANFPYPIMLVQHMPKTFTSVFAERLNQQCQIGVKEAEDGDQLIAGRALLAPGGMQMIIDPNKHDRVRVLVGDTHLTYKPSVDVTYASAARVFKGKVLAVILTGMGADGCDGARLLQREGATIWAQSRDTCTIYGMPQAVVNAGLATEVLDLTDIGPLLGQGRRV